MNEEPPFDRQAYITLGIMSICIIALIIKFSNKPQVKQEVIPVVFDEPLRVFARLQKIEKLSPFTQRAKKEFTAKCIAANSCPLTIEIHGDSSRIESIKVNQAFCTLEDRINSENRFIDVVYQCFKLVNTGDLSRGFVEGNIINTQNPFYYSHRFSSIVFYRKDNYSFILSRK